MFTNLILFLTDVVEQAPEVVEESFNIWKWLREAVTPEVIVAFVSLLFGTGSLGFVAKWAKKIAKMHIGTVKDVANVVNDSVTKGTQTSIDNVVAPLAVKIDEVAKTNLILAKAFALSIENTPESRLAVLELLQSTGRVSTETVEETRTKIKEEVEQKEKEKEEALKDLDSMIVEKQEENSVGRY